MLFNKSILVLKCVHLLFLCYVTENRRMITTIQYVVFVSLESLKMSVTASIHQLLK